MLRCTEDIQAIGKYNSKSHKGLEHPKILVILKSPGANSHRHWVTTGLTFECPLPCRGEGQQKDKKDTLECEVWPCLWWPVYLRVARNLSIGHMSSLSPIYAQPRSWFLFQCSTWHQNSVWPLVHLLGIPLRTLIDSLQKPQFILWALRINIHTIKL